MAKTKKPRKKPQPERGLHFLTPPEQYRDVAAKQRAWILGMADALERGEPLTKAADKRHAAGILRAHAATIPEIEPRARAGREAQVDAAEVAVQFVCLTNRGLSNVEARAHLADAHGVSDVTIQNALAKFGQAATMMAGVKQL